MALYRISSPLKDELDENQELVQVSQPQFPFLLALLPLFDDCSRMMVLTSNNEVNLPRARATTLMQWFPTFSTSIPPARL